MFEFLSNANTLVGIGAVIFALSYTFTSVRGGNIKGVQERAEAAEKLAETYEKRFDEQVRINEALRLELGTLRQEIGKLQGLHQANESKIKEYMELLGPSGELQATLKHLNEAAKVSKLAVDFMKDIREGKLSLPSTTSVTVKETTVK